MGRMATKKRRAEQAEPRKRGRKVQFTMGVEEISWLESNSKDLTVQQIADHFGVSKVTFHEELNVNSDAMIVYRKDYQFSAEDMIWLREKSAALTTQQVADHFGITAASLQRRLKRNQQAGRVWRRATSNALVDVKCAVLESAKKGNFYAQMFWMKCQAGWREKEISEREASSPNIIVVSNDQPTKSVVQRKLIGAMASVGKN